MAVSADSSTAPKPKCRGRSSARWHVHASWAPSMISVLTGPVCRHHTCASWDERKAAACSCSCSRRPSSHRDTALGAQSPLWRHLAEQKNCVVQQPAARGRASSRGNCSKLTSSHLSSSITPAGAGGALGKPEAGLQPHTQLLRLRRRLQMSTCSLQRCKCSSCLQR